MKIGDCTSYKNVSIRNYLALGLQIEVNDISAHYVPPNFEIFLGQMTPKGRFLKIYSDSFREDMELRVTAKFVQIVTSDGRQNFLIAVAFAINTQRSTVLVFSGRDNVERWDAGEVRGWLSRAGLRVRRSRLQPVWQPDRLAQDAASPSPRQRRRRSLQRVVADQHDGQRSSTVLRNQTVQIGVPLQSTNFPLRTVNYR